MNTSTYSGEYDHYLVMRDDSYWFAPLDLSSFPTVPGKSDSEIVYAKDCPSWGGVNDKVFLFGREAAKRILLNVFTDFLMDDPRLETKNAEQYWKAYFEIKGVLPVEVPFSMLQTADGIYHQNNDGSRAICIKKVYLCDRPVISPNVIIQSYC